MRLKRELLHTANAAALFVLLSLSLACWREELGRPYKLSTGRTIRLMRVGIPQDSPSEWHLIYQISNRVDDGGFVKRAFDREAANQKYGQELKKEIAEIWKDFQKDVDQAKVERAVIIAMTGGTFPLGEPRLRGEFYGRTRYCRFTRGADGTWSDDWGILKAAP